MCEAIIRSIIAETFKVFPSRVLPASNKVFIPQERQRGSGEGVTERECVFYSNLKQESSIIVF